MLQVRIAFLALTCPLFIGSSFAASPPTAAYDLVIAAGIGDLAKVKELLAADPTLINVDQQTGTPLHNAAEAGQKAVVEFLLSKGADVNAESQVDLSTPLHEVANGSGNKEIAELLIAKGAKVNAKRKRDGATPLHEAASRGNADIVKVLLSHGAVVDAKANGGQTPLYFAVVDGHRDIVELLIAKGADVNIKVGEVNTPLLEAAVNHYANVVNLLIAKGAKLDIFSAIALGKSEEIGKFLKADPALIRAKDEDGVTLLHLAVLVGQKGSVEILLANKADVNAKTKDGDTPLAIAENPWLGQQKEIAELLREHGAQK
jgi:ankyrin repeat protein